MNLTEFVLTAWVIAIVILLVAYALHVYFEARDDTHMLLCDREDCDQCVGLIRRGSYDRDEDRPYRRKYDDRTPR